MVKPETQKNEYKSSWHDHYYEWISGYANANGGTLYIGVNDDGYVIGLKDSKYLLDTLPNQVNSLMGITISIDHGCVSMRGDNLKYDEVPRDIAQKPENLYVRGILTKKALEDIDAAPSGSPKNIGDPAHFSGVSPTFPEALLTFLVS